MAGQLVPANTHSGPSFAQQGQVDWVALSNHSVHFTVSVLARLSKAGIDPLTVVVGRALFHSAVLTPAVQKRVYEALSKLKAFSSYGEVLWFGFGVRHIIHELAATEQGITAIAVLAAMRVSYDSFYAAQLLRELLRKLKGPTELLPSLHQWLTLIDVCAGALNHTKFPRLVDGFARILLPAEPGSGMPQAEPTEPKALAEVLVLLFDVAAGRSASCRVGGGIDCAWVAAVAEWLYGLYVEIRSEHDAAETILYRSSVVSSRFQDCPQVVIIKRSTGKAPSTALSRTFILPTGKMLILPRGNELRGSYFMRRSKWSNILADVFGHEALSALLQGARGSLFAHLLQNTLAHDIGSTEGLLNESVTTATFVVQALPELRLLDLSKVSRDANLHVEFRDICRCSRCKDYNTRAEKNNAFQYHPYCLLRIADTIGLILQVLRCVDLQEDLRPSHEGVIQIYAKHTSYRSDLYSPCGQLHKLSQVYGPTMLEQALIIFAGHVDARSEARFKSSLPAAVSATSDFAICAYKRTLGQPRISLAGAERIVVLTGSINHDGLDRLAVQDSKADNSSAFEHTMLTQEGGWEIDLIVEETIHSLILQCDYLVKIPAHDMVLKRPVCTVGPALMSSLAHDRFGFICPQSPGCQEKGNDGLRERWLANVEVEKKGVARASAEPLCTNRNSTVQSTRNGEWVILNGPHKNELYKAAWAPPGETLYKNFRIFTLPRNVGDTQQMEPSSILTAIYHSWMMRSTSENQAGFFRLANIKFTCTNCMIHSVILENMEQPLAVYTKSPMDSTSTNLVELLRYDEHGKKMSKTIYRIELPAYKDWGAPAVKCQWARQALVETVRVELF